MAETTINYCPRCGNTISQQHRFGKFRPVCLVCDWVYFADPKVAAAVLVEEDGCVLLVRRVNEPARGKWTLPAGFVDAGEDPASAAERECFEETGLSVSTTGLLDIVTGLEHPRGADMVIVYRARVQGGVLRAGDDADLAAWFSSDDLPPLAFEATRHVLGSAWKKNDPS
jgi:8-oxo-dGTP diphosphatase